MSNTSIKENESNTTDNKDLNLDDFTKVSFYFFSETNVRSLHSFFFRTDLNLLRPQFGIQTLFPRITTGTSTN